MCKLNKNLFMKICEGMELIFHACWMVGLDRSAQTHKNRPKFYPVWLKMLDEMLNWFALAFCSNPQIFAESS